MTARAFAIGTALPLALITFALLMVLLPERLPPPTEASASAGADRFACRVTGVHDGDGPIYCAGGTKIRLSAIAARELDETCLPGHPCPAASGASARDALRALADGRTLSCEKTGESYGRTVAWCWREDGLELNAAMVDSGHALRWDRYDRR